MHPTIRRTATVLLLSCLAAPALAENRLFPTDILEPGEVDASLGVAYAKSKTTTEPRNLSSGITWIGTTETFRATSESISVRYGVAPNWHIGVSQGYASRREQTLRSNDPTAPTATMDLGSYRSNAELSSNYRFIGDKDSRLSVVAKGTIAPSTAGHHESHFRAGIAGSWRSGNGFQGFSGYNAFYSDRATGVFHTISFGARQQVGSRFALRPSASVSRTPAGGSFPARNSYGLALGGEAQVDTNTYILPGVAFYRDEARDSKDGVLRVGPARMRVWSVSLYHLF